MQDSSSRGPGLGTPDLEWQALEKSFTKSQNNLLLLLKFSLKWDNFFHKRRKNCFGHTCIVWNHSNSTNVNLDKNISRGKHMVSNLYLVLLFTCFTLKKMKTTSSRSSDSQDSDDMDILHIGLTSRSGLWEWFLSQFQLSHHSNWLSAPSFSTHCVCDVP